MEVSKKVSSGHGPEVETNRRTTSSTSRERYYGSSGRVRVCNVIH